MPAAASSSLLLALIVLAAGCLPTERFADEASDLQVVSSPPDLISGGAARLHLRVYDGVAPEDVTLTLDGEPIAATWAPAEAPGVLEAVVTGLPEGAHTLTAHADDRTATLGITNHPAAGPMFSGPPQDPFYCATERHRSSVGLGPILDDDCSMETVVSYVYRSAETDDFRPYDPAAPRPPDLAQTTTLDGQTVDYIVRWERGTLNRFIYSLAVLVPAPEAAPAADAAPDLSLWNGRLVYSFQGGVGVGRYQGSPSRSGMLYRNGLDKGYAVAYSTGTRTSVHYDLEVGGETALMVKSRFVTAYGRPRYTVGVGGSGGGIQQYVYGQNHPGLLDAAVPQYSYPDMVTQTIHVGDCELLERYMDAEVAKDPVSKWATWSNRSWLQGLNASDTLPNEYRGGAPGLTECINGWRGLSPLSLNPHYGTAPGITPEEQAATVWTHFEDARQIYGVAADGYAARTWDNVGVQYGLGALRDGHITPDEFLDLNARVGGWKDEAAMVQEGRPFVDGDGYDPHSARNMTLSPDDTGTPPAPRTAADPGAIERAIEGGLVFRGALEIPTIDWRHYLEPVLDMHNSHQSFAARQRMLNHDGDAANQLVWFTAIGPDGRPQHDQTPMAFAVIDAWMANLEAHPERGVVGNKPPRAVDSCFDAAGEPIYAGADAWAGILDDAPPGPCTQRFPIYSTSRIVAGAPITGDVFKCALQPVEDAIQNGLYGDWQLTPEQVERLQVIFPTGVCDYEAPAVVAGL